jgi:hypothetical protein
MIKNLIRSLSKALRNCSSPSKPSAQLTPKTWLNRGSAAHHTSKFIKKQAVKGFKFPK